jgi:WD40 repeat protein
VYTVAFSPDGKTIAAAGLDRTIRVIDVLTGKEVRAIEKHKDFIYRVAFNSKGTRLLSCGYSGNVYIWNPTNGQLLFEKQLDKVAHSAQYSPDGGRIIVPSADGRAYFIDVPPASR